MIDLILLELQMIILILIHYILFESWYFNNSFLECIFHCCGTRGKIRGGELRLLFGLCLPWARKRKRKRKVFNLFLAFHAQRIRPI